MSALAVEKETDELELQDFDVIVKVALGKCTHSICINNIKGVTGADVKELLKQGYYPNLPCKYMRLLVKGKEMQDAEGVSEFVPKKKKKKDTVVKCKLLFQSSFHTDLSESQKEIATKLQDDKAVGIKKNDEVVETESDAVREDGAPRSMENKVHFMGLPPGCNSKNGSIHVTVIQRKRRHKFCVGLQTTVSQVGTKLGELTGIDVRRFQFLAKGKKVSLGTLFSAITKQGGKLTMRVLFDEKFHIQNEGQNVLEHVISSLEKTEKQVHSMYSKLAHNFFDHAVLTLRGQSFDEELDALERSLTIIKVKPSEEPKREVALARLKLVQEKNAKINGILEKKG